MIMELLYILFISKVINSIFLDDSYSFDSLLNLCDNSKNRFVVNMKYIY